MTGKLNFQCSLSHDASEIIPNVLICAQ